MLREVVIREQFQGIKKGSDLLRRLRQAVQNARRTHPELAGYALYDVGISSTGPAVNVSMYFKPERP